MVSIEISISVRKFCFIFIFLKIKSKTHIDSIVENAEEKYTELREEVTRCGDRERPLNKLNTFQLTNLQFFNQTAQELFEKNFKLHFLDFVSKYVKWLK
jgi:hypothetical protein